MEQSVSILGMSIVIISLLIEFVAFAGMASYPIRRAIPGMTPIQLQSIGCTGFFTGVIILLAGRYVV